MAQHSPANGGIILSARARSRGSTECILLLASAPVGDPLPAGAVLLFVRVRLREAIAELMAMHLRLPFIGRQELQ